MLKGYALIKCVMAFKGVSLVNPDHFFKENICFKLGAGNLLTIG